MFKVIHPAVILRCGAQLGNKAGNPRGKLSRALHNILRAPSDLPVFQPHLHSQTQQWSTPAAVPAPQQHQQQQSLSALLSLLLLLLTESWGQQKQPVLLHGP
jgi:ABC-type transport system involved in cytochrome bd biosynthesis fused ATPase/permease subunit